MVVEFLTIDFLLKKAAGLGDKVFPSSNCILTDGFWIGFAPQNSSSPLSIFLVSFQNSPSCNLFIKERFLLLAGLFLVSSSDETLSSSLIKAEF